jgi:hypothetical protein
LYFEYGSEEIEYLKKRDKLLDTTIDRIGHIYHTVDGDLAIHRGMRMLYHHKSIGRKRFVKYARRYSTYGTVASLYLWAIAGGAIPEMRDYASKKKKEASRK